MNQLQKSFFDNLEEFRKINLAGMFPGLSQGDLCMMKTMYEHLLGEAPMRVSDIVEKLRIPPPAVSRSLKGMEQKGWINRRVDENDRRNTFVEFTAAGELLSSEIEIKMGDLADAVFAEIGEETFRQLNAYMQQLIEVTQCELAKRKEK